MGNQLQVQSSSPDLAPRLVATAAFAPRAEPRRPLVRLQPQGPGVDLDSLRCFDAVATTLRFRSAAVRVHLSPAAFSDRIRRLEESIGAPILRRTTRAVALTDTGERLLPLARRILSLVDCVPSTVLGVEAPLAYQLVVGSRYEVALSWLCATLDPLARRRPERTLHVYNGSTDDLVSRLERGELDAVVGSMRLGNRRLATAALHTEEYALVGADRTLRGREDARRLTLVDINPNLPLFRYFLDAQPSADPWPFARVEYMGGIANIRQRLLAREGRVGVLPTFFIKEDLAKRRLHRLLPRMHLQSDTMRLIWRPDHPRQSELIALAADLREFPLR